MMLPQFRRVLDSGKKLIIWGALDQEDLLTIMEEIPPHSIYLNIVVEAVDQAKNLMYYLQQLAEKKRNPISG